MTLSWEKSRCSKICVS